MIESSERIIKHKVGLLNLAEELGNVSQACKVMGLSRDTFYRCKSAVEDGGVEALLDKSRRKPNLKNRVDLSIEQAVISHAIEQPAHGQARTSNKLRKQGVFVSSSGVCSIWLRHHLAELQAAPEGSCGRCQCCLNNPQKCWVKIPQFWVCFLNRFQVSSPLFFLGRPLLFGGCGGIIGALVRICSGMRSACPRSR